MVAFDRLEQGLEVALAESIVTLALDELEENRAEQGVGKDLQQQAPFSTARAPVEQDAACGQGVERLAMPGQAPVEHAVVGGWWRAHQRHTGALEAVDTGIDVVAQQRDMLDAFTVELEQELLDLPGAARSLLVERDADLAIGRGHGLGRQAGVFALDVEKAHLAEVEQLRIKPRPIRHATAVHVVRHVVDDSEPVAQRMAVRALDEIEVDVVDRLAFLEAVDQVQGRTADALDGGQVQFHRAGAKFYRLCTQFECALESQARVLDPESQPAGRGPVLRREIRGHAARLAVDDEVDVALAVQRDVLRTVLGHTREPQHLEHRLEHAGRRGRELHELETHQAHWIAGRIRHDTTPRCHQCCTNKYAPGKKYKQYSTRCHCATGPPVSPVQGRSGKAFCQSNGSEAPPE